MEERETRLHILPHLNSSEAVYAIYWKTYQVLRVTFWTASSALYNKVGSCQELFIAPSQVSVTCYRHTSDSLQQPMFSVRRTGVVMRCFNAVTSINTQADVVFVLPKSCQLFTEVQESIILTNIICYITKIANKLILWQLRVQ